MTSFSRLCFASFFGAALIGFSIWFYRNGSVTDAELETSRLATNCACALCAVFGIFFIAFALKMACAANAENSLANVAVTVVVGVSLLGFALWFFREEAKGLLKEESRLKEQKEYLSKRPKEFNIIERGFQLADNAAMPERYRKSSDELRDEFYGKDNAAFQKNESSLAYVRREYQIVAFGSGACALAGIAFLLIALKLWLPPSPPRAAEVEETQSSKEPATTLRERRERPLVQPNHTPSSLWDWGFLLAVIGGLLAIIVYRFLARL